MTDTADLGADGPAATARYTFDAVIPGTRRVVARAVASEPLDCYAAAGLITEAQYDAGKRLRTILASTWPAPRCTAPGRYVTAGSELDEEDDDATEDDRWASRARAWTERVRAQGVIGRHDWQVVRTVCEGGRLGRADLVRYLRRGLDRLAEEWR